MRFNARSIVSGEHARLRRIKPGLPKALPSLPITPFLTQSLKVLTVLVNPVLLVSLPFNCGVIDEIDNHRK